MTALLSRFVELCDRTVPLPGGGRTLDRWRFLADVAAEDLALVKLVESHFDAVAILHELGSGDLVSHGQRWAVWAAEPPDGRLSISATGLLSGPKAWCSGAQQVTHALVTTWDPDGRQQLAAVDLTSDSIEVHSEAWRAVGMGRAPTPDLVFDGVAAQPIGAPGAYLERAGFWHGGAGVAACWYGGMLPLAAAVLSGRQNPHRRAHAGALDVALRSLRALLLETATRIDTHPAEVGAAAGYRIRAAADQTARLVLDLSGRALGAGPLCRDDVVAEHFADLPVFIRQTHAERDLAELAVLLAENGPQWTL